MEQRREHGCPGAADLRLPDGLRGPLLEHIEQLRQRYLARGWGSRVGFGERPALVVIDLALGWTTDRGPMGSNLDAVVEATGRVLAAARRAGIPVFFTTGASDPADPPNPGEAKLPAPSRTGVPQGDLMELDPRLGRRPAEKILRKPYASAFKGTNF
ncbi:MAG: isochorismatase family protein, partial [Candidatus Latescibacterota bacterium]